MENEDDILNVEFDPSELENVDEDELLGGASSARFESKRYGTNALNVGAAKEIDVNVSSESGGNGGMDDSRDSGSSENEEDEDEDDRDRSKFHQERPSGAADQRRVRERSDIPDSLDKVKLNEKERAMLHDPRRGGGGRGRNQFVPNSSPKRVLLNPHFQGRVPVIPPMRLAWDPRAHLRPPMPHYMNRPGIGTDIRLPVSISPCPIQRMPLQRPAGPPHQMRMSGPMNMVPPRMQSSGPVPSLLNIHPHPSMHRMPPPNARYPRPPWSHGQSSLPPSSSYQMGPPSSGSMLYTPIHPRASSSPSSAPVRPLINYSMPPPSIRPSPPKSLADLSGSTKPTSSDEWLHMTEDFLRKTRLPIPPSVPMSRLPSACDKSSGNNVNNMEYSPVPHSASRQRQAAADVKRKYRNQNDRQKKQPLNAKITSNGQNAASVGAKVTKSAGEGVVDTDYMRKLDEQKRLRELLLKQKEQRRALMAKKRQQQQPSVSKDNLFMASIGSRLGPLNNAEMSLASSSSSTQRSVQRRRL